MRRGYWTALALVVAASLPWHAPNSEIFPSRPIHLVVPFPAGSGADILCRHIGERIGAAAGATIVVENKPGASGNIGTEIVARARPDGYTLLMGASSTLGGSPSVYRDLTWNPVKDFEPVGLFATLGYMLTISAKNPAKSAGELAVQLKGKAGKATFGYGNVSGLGASALYANEAGFTATAVAYKSNPQAVSDAAASLIDYVFSDALYAIGQQRAGAVKLLAVTTPERLGAAPDMPTMREAGFAAATMAPWWGMFAPARTPDEIVAKLSGWLAVAARSPDTRAFLSSQGIEPMPGTRDETRKLLAATLEEWARISRIAKLEPQ